MVEHRVLQKKPGRTSIFRIDLAYGYGSIPINTIFSGMNIHLPAILMFTRGFHGFWHTAISASHRHIPSLHIPCQGDQHRKHVRWRPKHLRGRSGDGRWEALGTSTQRRPDMAGCPSASVGNPNPTYSFVYIYIVIYIHTYIYIYIHIYIFSPTARLGNQHIL